MGECRGQGPTGQHQPYDGQAQDLREALLEDVRIDVEGRREDEDGQEDLEHTVAVHMRRRAAHVYEHVSEGTLRERDSSADVVVATEIADVFEEV